MVNKMISRSDSTDMRGPTRVKTDRRACPLRVRGHGGHGAGAAGAAGAGVSAKHISYAVLPPVRSAECNASGVFVT